MYFILRKTLQCEKVQKNMKVWEFMRLYKDWSHGELEYMR